MVTLTLVRTTTIDVIHGADDTKDVLTRKGLKSAYTALQEPRKSDDLTTWLHNVYLTFSLQSSSPIFIGNQTKPAQAYYCPKIAAFIRATTLAVCCSLKWLYLLTMVRVLCPRTAAISIGAIPADRADGRAELPLGD